MRKLVSVFLMVACLFSMTQVVYAQSVTAANIFSSLGGDTTITQGGVIHSQARTIYSMGGGMASFKGKNVSLLSADPPSFSAGCTGISWHFGGFAFISLDEIRQLVEAVAQASLGVVVDLAMQTLCPQCYAVMSKLRDLASMMRNAAANSCRIAEMIGAEAEKGISSALGNQGLCGNTAASSGSSDSFLGSLVDDTCSTLGDINTGLSSISTGINSFFGGSSTGSSGTTPTKEQLNMEGNQTYEELSALGYQDGFLKDIMLSLTGMTLHTLNPATDCSGVFQSMTATAVANAQETAAMTQTATMTSSNTGSVVYSASGSAYSAVLGGVNGMLSISPPDAIVSSGGNSVGATPAMSQFTTAATPNPGDSNQGTNTCFAPPLLTGFGDVARTLICGINPSQDVQTFLNRSGVNLSQFENGPVWAMCLGTAQNGSFNGPDVASSNPNLYHCVASGSNRCLNPTLTDFNTDSGAANSSGMYTGLVWMVMDAIYQGTIAVANNQPWPAETLAIVNGSDYPLYRIINLSAVYPGMAGDLLNAYGSVIAVQYATDTLDKLSAPGALPGIDLRAAHAGTTGQSVRQMHEQLMNMIHDAGPLKDEVLKRLNEKRALVDTIVQVNRALQADVLSQGLAGNANLAMSIKDQLSRVTPAK
jgi:hypothetical protein